MVIRDEEELREGTCALNVSRNETCGRGRGLMSDRSHNKTRPLTLSDATCSASWRW